MHKQRENLDDQQLADIKSKKQSPILFSTQMVEAILNNTKSQTRRIVKQNRRWCEDVDEVDLKSWFEKGIIKSPYGEKGDMLWIRETWKMIGHTQDDHTEFHFQYKDGEDRHIDFYGDDDRCEYWVKKLDDLCANLLEKGLAEENDEEERYTWNKEDVPWKPSIHMPKEVARIWLKISDIRVERLHDISDVDCVEEGIKHSQGKSGPLCWYDYKHKSYNAVTGVTSSFKTLWQTVNGPGSWNINPWVWVISFEQIENPNK